MRRDVFQAIADPVRREIIELLSEDDLTVNAVADQFDISRPAISKHIKILEECELISIKQLGRERICKIEPRNLIPAFMWVDQYRKLWEDKIDSFETYINQLHQQQKQKDNE